MMTISEIERHKTAEKGTIIFLINQALVTFKGGKGGFFLRLL